MSTIDIICSKCYIKPSEFICGCSNIALCEQCKDSHINKGSKECLIQEINRSVSYSAKSIIELKSDSVIKKLEQIKQNIFENNCIDDCLDRDILEGILNLDITMIIPDITNYIYHSKIDGIIKVNPKKVINSQSFDKDDLYESKKKLNLASCIVTFNRKVALFGGFDDEWQPSKTINCYSCIENKWEEKTLKRARSFSAGVYAGNYLFIIGGMSENRESMKSIEIFDENLNFCKEENTNKPHLYPSATVHLNSIYIISSDTPNYIEAFNYNDSSSIKLLNNIVSMPSLISSNDEQIIILSKNGAYDLENNWKGNLEFKEKLPLSGKLRLWSQQAVFKCSVGLVYFDYFSSDFAVFKV
ncbi:hypothetical protein SteCoe_17850 [Stentor coeruleus]|uniref:Uncharacterized protein n=1 Tax=Stentor coeruleus TaxID=5963 RepID=A0A1R2BY12_9CILI|nr:hypothetical protein SteCoe_17850 [Stentor coeruleus]